MASLGEEAGGSAVAEGEAQGLGDGGDEVDAAVGEGDARSWCRR